MGKVKIKRKSTLIDMTAMSDVTVLLLTFFMLTSTFLAKEPTVVMTPSSVSEEKVPMNNLVTILDGYFENGGQHVNLNVMDLKDVYDKIMNGEDVIVRISGYCVNTKYLTKEQKTELTQRVFHEVLSMDDAAETVAAK